MSRPRVLLADDHRIVAEGLRGLLEPHFELVGVVENGRDMIEAAKRLRPDVIVADISMPHFNGIDALVKLKADDPHVRVVFLTMHTELAYLRRALAEGAAGFVLKHSASAELVQAIRAALAGKRHVTPSLANKLVGDVSAPTITPRQREILQLMAEGKSAKEMAAVLGISARTVEFHKYKLMESLGLKTSAELVHYAIKSGIVTI